MIRLPFLVFSLLALCIGFSIIACAPDQKNPILGKWEAFEITEEGYPLQVNASEIQFEFKENGRYFFKSTLNYHEAGHFHTQSNYLFTKDTLQSASPEKMVIIESIQGDSLVIEMRQDEKNRKIKLKKII